MARVLFVAKIAVDKDTGMPLPELRGQGGQIIARGNPTGVRGISEDEAGTLTIPGSSLTVSGDGFVPSFWVDEDDLPVSWWDGQTEVPLESVEGVSRHLNEYIFETNDRLSAVEGVADDAAAAAAASVKTINGVPPDEDGDVVVEGGEGGGGVAGVTAVNGRSGNVSLSQSDVGLGNVDNTADLAKPVSTAVTDALAGKANTSHSHVISQVSGLQAALDSKLGVNEAPGLGGGNMTAVLRQSNGSWPSRPDVDAGVSVIWIDLTAYAPSDPPGIVADRDVVWDTGVA